MSFLDHLEELRRRLIRSLIAIAAGMVVAYAFKERIADLFLAPIEAMLPAGAEFIATKPGEIFSFYLNVALVGGVVLAAPAVMYQVWRFIAPALYANEKRLAIPFVLLATVGTICGVLFNTYLLFPAMMKFFAGFSSAHIRLMPRIEDTYDQFLRMTLGMVVVFQMPTLALFLAKMRVITAGLLWRHIKYAVLLIFIVAAVLTPSTDPWNQLVFAAPMLALYVVSIALAWAVQPRKTAPERGSHPLRLVVAAAVLDHARTARRSAQPRNRGFRIIEGRRSRY
jgi:sec-independent protein translocase protein TatC